MGSVEQGDRRGEVKHLDYFLVLGLWSRKSPCQLDREELAIQVAPREEGVPLRQGVRPRRSSPPRKKFDLFILLFVHPTSVCSSTHPSNYQTINLSIHLPAHPFMHLLQFLSFYLSTHPPIHPSFHPSSIHPSVHSSIQPSIHFRTFQHVFIHPFIHSLPFHSSFPFIHHPCIHSLFIHPHVCSLPIHSLLYCLATILSFIYPSTT